METVEILGVKISRVGFAQALQLIESFLRDGGKHLVVTPYAESVVDAQKDEEFRRIVNSASLSVPDGGSLLAAAEYLSYPLPKNKILKLPAAVFLGLWVGLRLALAPKTFKILTERVSGTDLVVKLCELGSERDYKVYLLGGKGGEASEAAQVLKSKYPNFQIVSDPGPTDVQNASDGEMKITVKKINEYSPDFLFVAFRPTYQEKWLFYHLKETNAKVFMAVGGAFNMISGRKKRAPKMLQKFNLEWLWRLIIEPARIVRIFKAVVVFPQLVFCQKLNGSKEISNDSPPAKPS